jgi:hypothetical protein
MRITLRAIGLFGILFFGVLFLVTFLSPETIEESSKEFVKFQIEKEVREKQRQLGQSSLAEKALGMSELLGVESAKIQSDLDNKLPEKIADIVAAMCGYDCEKKKAVAQSIATRYMDRIKSIELAQDTLGDVIKGKYIEIVGNLKFDLRIFLGANFGMFLILFVVSLAKPKAVVHLFFPALLLLLATIISTSIYLFGQDWFYTILYNDYMGFGYLVYIAVIFGVLMDIFFNGAKITTEVINGIANAIGSAFSVAPC